MEQSNNIDIQVIPERVLGKTIYRCPYEGCGKKSDRKQVAVDHVRSIHLQLKKYCETCEKNVSFVSYERHAQLCRNRNACATNKIKTNKIITRSASKVRTNPIYTTNFQQQRNSIDLRLVTGTYFAKVEKASFQPKYQIDQPNAVNQIALFSYESREDEFQIFSKFVAAEMRALTRKDQFNMKKRIQQLLLEYEPERSPMISNNQIIAQESGTLNRDCSKVAASNSQNIASVDASMDDEFHGFGSSILIMPKLEIVVDDNVLKPQECLLCNCHNSDLSRNLN